LKNAPSVELLSRRLTPGIILDFLTESAESTEAVLCVLRALCEKQKVQVILLFRGIALQT
jgi:hypothetical protein